MKCAAIYKPGDVRFEERPIPCVGSDDVLIKVKHVGVCGSDVHLYKGVWDIKMSPLVLGHESAGIVIETGENIKHLHKGDVVAIEPAVPCGTCEYCRTGRYNLCLDVVCMADNMDGAFSEYVVHNGHYVYALPDNMDTLDGALLEPLAVGMYAVAHSGAKAGQSAFVFGCGCIGIMTMLSLKSIGVTEIYMADIIPMRMEKAKEMGATRVFDFSSCDIVEAINKIKGTCGVDMVYDATGSNNAISSAVSIVKRGGVVTFVGIMGGNIPFDFSRIPRDAWLTTTFRYRNNYGDAIKAVQNGLINLKPVVTNIFPFDKVDEALEYCSVNAAKSVKTVIEFNA